MLYAYINRARSRIILHTNPACHLINMNRGAERRRMVKLDSQSLPIELERFRQGIYPLVLSSRYYDIWLEVDLGNEQLELAAVNQVRAVLVHTFNLRFYVMRRHC